MPDREDYRLRPIEERDLELVLQWRNSDRIRRYMYRDTIIEMDEHREWYSRLAGNADAVYLLFEANHTPLGVVNFTDIDRINGRCFWGFYLGEEHLPRGTGTIMGVLGLEYAFETLKIRKLCGEVFGFNSSSLKFFKRLGFATEGHFVEHVLKGDRYEDIITFAMFKTGWLENRHSLEAAVFPDSRL